MYLKSLTLRGFKSFASATTLQLEPGITCIVGPNGSGKSNVVDALAWVMGEQGAKSLRGGKMEDVIFAGTGGERGRPPLGRAEVALTIDNSDGALPIDYSEVTISRTMFRNGGSEYAINGSSCRLLDVQELLSDSGIGREMHVIVGQGQLDSILHATPEDRRGFIEEAAGVLKHRKRKEKALRKLDSTEGNLTRLQDLLSEIRRQLKPLGRQAEVARKAAVVQADVRDARARLLADDLVTARTALEQELADETILLERRAEVEAAIERARSAEATLEAALREDLPALAAAQETWFALSGLRERLRGTAGLAAERMRNAQDGDEPVERSGRDPEDLLAEAERVRAQEQQIGTEVRQHQGTLDEALATRQRVEQQHAEEERRVAGLQRAAADRREGLARLRGQVHALRSRAAAADEEVGRLTGSRQDAAARADRAQRDFTSLESRVAGLDAGEEGLDAEHEGAASALADLEDRLAKTREEAQAAERERTGLAARKEALEIGLNRKDGVGALLAASDSVSGLLGSVAALLSVRAGYETAVAAALGVGRGRGRRRARRRRSRRHRAPQDRGPRPRRHPARSAGPTVPTGRGTVAPAASGRRCRRHVVRRRRGGVPGGAAAVAAPAAVQGRGGRRPGRRPRPGGRPPRRHRGHPRRRPARRQLRLRRLVLAAEPHRGAGRRRRGRRAAVRGVARLRAARLRPVPARGGARPGAAPRRRRAREAARVRRDPRRGGRGAGAARVDGPVREGRGRAGVRRDRRRRGGPRPRPVRARRPRGPAGRRRRRAGRGARHRRAGAARRAGPRRPAGRDGRPARAAHRGGAGPGARRPRRLPGPGRPGRAGRPAPGRSPGASGCSARARSPRPSAAASPSC